MKNKKFTIGLTLLLAGSLLFTNCTKNKTNEAPTPDSDVQSTKDVTKMQMLLSDIIEIAGQGNDGASGLLPFLSYTPLMIAQGVTTITSTDAVLNLDLVNKFYTVTFNNTVGKDGRVRNGVLTFSYAASSNSLVPQIFHRTPGYIADVTATGYTVDDYSVTINSMQIRNLTPVGFPNVSPYFPSAYNLSWSIAADISVASASGNSSISGNFTKTLLNTNNTPVPMPLIGSQTFTVYQSPTYASLNWAKAYINYNGTGSCTVGGVTSTYTLTNCTRNMNSSPEMFYAPGSLFQKPERHPFLSGMMTFKPASKSIREVNFGQGDVVDYNAKVTIEGVTYDADCRD